MQPFIKHYRFVDGSNLFYYYTHDGVIIAEDYKHVANHVHDVTVHNEIEDGTNTISIQFQDENNPSYKFRLRNKGRKEKGELCLKWDDSGSGCARDKKHVALHWLPVYRKLEGRCWFYDINENYLIVKMRCYEKTGNKGAKTDYVPMNKPTSVLWYRRKQ